MEGLRALDHRENKHLPAANILTALKRMGIELRMKQREAERSLQVFEVWSCVVDLFFEFVACLPNRRCNSAIATGIVPREGVFDMAMLEGHLRQTDSLIHTAQGYIDSIHAGQAAIASISNAPTLGLH